MVSSAMLFSILEKVGLNQRHIAHSVIIAITEPWELEGRSRCLTGGGRYPALNSWCLSARIVVKDDLDLLTPLT